MFAFRRAVGGARCHLRREVGVVRIAPDQRRSEERAFCVAPAAQALCREAAIGQQRRIARRRFQACDCDGVRTGGISRAAAQEEREGEAVGGRGRGAVDARGAVVDSRGAVDVAAGQEIVAARNERRRDVAAKEQAGTREADQRDGDPTAARERRHARSA